MNDQDQQAMAWAKANPSDPRSKHIQAKIWANSNPDDPRAAQVLDQLSKVNSTLPPIQGNPYNVSITQDKPSNKAQGVIDKMANMNNDTFFNKDPELAKFKKDTDVTGDTVNQIGANLLLPGMAGVASKGAGVLGRLGIGALVGGTQGAVRPDGDSTSNALQGAAMGTLVGSGIESLRGLLGGLKGAAGNVSKAYQLSKGSPEIQKQVVDSMDRAMSSLEDEGNFNQYKYLQGKSNSPITAVTSTNPDDRARLQTISSISGEPLADMGNDLNAALKTAKSPLTKGPVQTFKQGVKGAASTVLSPSDSIMTDPRTLAAILNLLGK